MSIDHKGEFKIAHPLTEDVAQMIASRLLMNGSTDSLPEVQETIPLSKKQEAITQILLKGGSFEQGWLIPEKNAVDSEDVRYVGVWCSIDKIDEHSFMLCFNPIDRHMPSDSLDYSWYLNMVLFITNPLTIVNMIIEVDVGHAKDDLYKVIPEPGVYACAGPYLPFGRATAFNHNPPAVVLESTHIELDNLIRSGTKLGWSFYPYVLTEDSLKQPHFSLIANKQSYNVTIKFKSDIMLIVPTNQHNKLVDLRPYLELLLALSKESEITFIQGDIASIGRIF